MTPSTRVDLSSLTVAERIQLATELWDSVAAEPESVPVTDAQRRLVIQRSAAHANDPSTAVPLDEALDRIEASLQ